MQTPQDSSAIVEIFQDKLLTWNTDGYEGLPDGMLIWAVELGSVHACHPGTGILFRVRQAGEGLWQLDEIVDYSPENLQSSKVKIDTYRFGSYAGLSFTDVQFIPETQRLYMLDSEGSRINVLDLSRRFLGMAAGASRYIPITLPPGVVLDKRSRLEVVSQDPNQPERRDPFFYVSCSTSSVILKIDSDTGAATVALGRPGRSGNTKSGVTPKEVLLRRPTALHYDSRSGMLFWADSGAREVSVLADGRVLNVAQFSAAVEITSIVVYRVFDHVDKMLVSKAGSKNVSFWRDDPALLFAADSKSSEIFKIRLYEAERRPHGILSLTLSRSVLSKYQRALDRLFVLPDGDLLITTASTVSYHLRYGIGPHSNWPREEIAS